MFYRPTTQGVIVSDIYIVDAEYYMLVSGAGELVQNPGAGDVETRFERRPGAFPAHRAFLPRSAQAKR